MNKNPTIRDVARACGLSHMTVSNVLNNRPVVSEKTRTEVLETMKKLKFQPNAVARGLNRKSMNCIGVVLPNAYEAPTSHPYYLPVLNGIMSAAVSSRLDVIVYTGSLWTEEDSHSHPYLDGRSDGLVVVSPMIDSSLVSRLLERGCPFVCLGVYFAEPRVSCVCVDDGLSEMAVVEYLVKLGHRRIAMFQAETIHRWVDLRTDGYRMALKKHGLDIDESLILPGGIDEKTVIARLESLMAMEPSRRPTAICAANDQIALIVLLELARKGVQVPQEISVVGFDDITDAAPANLTTMRQPIQEMGYRAAEILTLFLADPTTPPIKEFFPTTLIERSTVGRTQ